MIKSTAELSTHPLRQGEIFFFESFTIDLIARETHWLRFGQGNLWVNSVSRIWCHLSSSVKLDK
jgi:hypothetical protein